MKQVLCGLLCLAALPFVAGQALAFGHHNQPVFRQHTVIRGGVGVNVGVPVVPGNAFVGRSYYVQQAPVLVQQSPVLVQRSFVQQQYVQPQLASTIVQQAPVYTQQVQRSFVQQQQYVQPQLAQTVLQQAPAYTQQVAADVQSLEVLRGQCQTCGVQAASFAPSYATGGCATGVGVGASFAPGYGTVPTYPTVGIGASFAPGYGTVPGGHGVFRQRTVQRY